MLTIITWKLHSEKFYFGKKDTPKGNFDENIAKFDVKCNYGRKIGAYICCIFHSINRKSLFYLHVRRKSSTRNEKKRKTKIRYRIYDTHGILYSCHQQNFSNLNEFRSYIIIYSLISAFVTKAYESSGACEWERNHQISDFNLLFSFFSFIGVHTATHTQLD